MAHHQTNPFFWHHTQALQLQSITPTMAKSNSKESANMRLFFVASIKKMTGNNAKNGFEKSCWKELAASSRTNVAQFPKLFQLPLPILLTLNIEFHCVPTPVESQVLVGERSRRTQRKSNHSKLPAFRPEDQTRYSFATAPASNWKQ